MCAMDIVTDANTTSLENREKKQLFTPPMLQLPYRLGREGKKEEDNH